MTIRNSTQVFAHLLKVEGRNRLILCMDEQQGKELELPDGYSLAVRRYSNRITNDTIVELGPFLRGLDLDTSRPQMYAEISYLLGRMYDYKSPNRERGEKRD